MLQHRTKFAVDLHAKLRRLHVGGEPRAPTRLADSVGSLPEALDRGHPRETPHGIHWIIQRDLFSLWPAGEAYLGDSECSWATATTDMERHPELRALASVLPAGGLFLDLETCGFAGSMVFLIGLLHQHHGRWTLSQLWARNYSEEGPLLETLHQLIQPSKVLVTFNGKSFDWPQVRDRWLVHHFGRAERLPELPHCDLLHHARRKWKDQLPNCKLQTLERFCCGRARSGDIPGRDIPDTYHAYVRTGDASAINSILHHNALDLVTLLQLSLQMLK